MNRSSKNAYLLFLILTLPAAAAVAVLHWRADNPASVWLAPDQQGLAAFRNGDFEQAAALFESPAWKGHAAYHAGQYAEAGAVLERLATPEAQLDRGNALMKARDYAGAISAYEQALKSSPGWPAASENLSLAKFVKDYLANTRTQLDTGDNIEYGADDVVFDNNNAEGPEVQLTSEVAIEALSAEKWMRTVDTQMQDFLRARFVLEAARKPPQ